MTHQINVSDKFFDAIIAYGAARVRQYAAQIYEQTTGSPEVDEKLCKSDGQVVRTSEALLRAAEAWYKTYGKDSEL